MTGVEPNDDTLYFNDLYARTMTLIEDVRDFIASGDHRRVTAEAEPDIRMRAAAELSRLTSRATAAMSLVLLYQAVVEGQADEITDSHRQLGEVWQTVCDGVVAAPEPGIVPAELQTLVERGDALFASMPRLRTMVEQRL